MGMGYNIEVVETHSVPIVSEKRATSFYDHTMEEDLIDDEVLINSKKINSEKIDLEKI